MACRGDQTREDGDVLLLVEHETVDICKRHINNFPDAIKKRNKTGETSLHIATRNPDLYDKVDLLLNKGADVNAKNYWGQTPLHYAAKAASVKIIHRLLLDTSINVSCTDANGYTALHVLVISIEYFTTPLQKCMQSLVEAGLDINSTTNIGESILHELSKLKHPLGRLSRILEMFPRINLFLKDLEGSTFLHSLAPFEEAHFTLFENIRKIKNMEIVQQLLNEKDCSGVSPWTKTVNNASTSITVIQKLVDVYAVAVDDTDYMENTALHVLHATSKFERIEELIKLGINVNSKNKFGQTALSLLQSDDMFEVFSKFEVEYDTRDRWGRTPFFEVISETGVYPLTLQKLLQKRKKYIFEYDIWDATPLHFAAFFGNTYKVKFHLDNNAERQVLDKMKDTPAGTARRHWNLACYKLLNNHDDINVYVPPTKVTAKELKGLGNIRELVKGLPKDMTDFSDQLLRSKHIQYVPKSESDENEKETEIISSVEKLVHHICDAVKNYDPRFEMSVLQTGSTAEGTKVGQPDEFDFALRVETLSKHCDIEMPTNYKQDEFVSLRFKKDLAPVYVSFTDENRYFVALPFLHLLFRYVRRALKETKLWIDGNLYMRPNDPIRVLTEKPVFNFSIYWNGSKYKKLKISIDLVPVVHKLGWWPNSIRANTRKLLAAELKGAGCFVLLHPKINEFNLWWHVMNDNIDTTCKQNKDCTGKQTNNNDHLLLRISVAPVEIALMKSFPDEFRKAYALAKLVKCKDVCPGVQINDIPQYFGKSFEKNNTLKIIDCSRQIKSYWLKNCTFYVAEEIINPEYKQKTPLVITKLIYKKLLKCATSCQLKAYVFPQSDILAIEKDEAKSIDDVRKLLLMRKVCIDMVLGILGEPYPEDNKDWIQSCEKYYAKYVPTAEEQASQIPSVG